MCMEWSLPSSERDAIPRSMTILDCMQQQNIMAKTADAVRCVFCLFAIQWGGGWGGGGNKKISL